MSGKFTFTLEDSEGFGIEMTLPEGLNVTSMLEAFENFLLACGYRLQEKESVGIVSEEDWTEREDPKDSITDGLFADSNNFVKFDGAQAWWDSGMGMILGADSPDTISFNNA